jgi:hypothetical protein
MAVGDRIAAGYTYVRRGSVAPAIPSRAGDFRAANGCRPQS